MLLMTRRGASECVTRIAYRVKCRSARRGGGQGKEQGSAGGHNENLINGACTAVDRRASGQRVATRTSAGAPQ